MRQNRAFVSQLASGLILASLLSSDAAAFNQQYIGRDITDTKDTNGKLFNQESITIAKTKGEGWSEYMYPKPGELAKPTPFKEKISSKKLSYVYRIPGKDLMVIAGFFE